MSFDSKSFSILAYSNGFTLWNYATADSLAQIKKKGYFDEISPFARVGDMVCITSNLAQAATSSILAVSKIESGKVTMSNLAN